MGLGTFEGAVEMDRKTTLGWLAPVLALGAAACGGSEPATPPAATFTVAGNGEAVNAFVADLLVKQVPQTMTVAHRGDGLVATFSLAGFEKAQVIGMTRQALSQHLSYSLSGIAVHA